MATVDQIGRYMSLRSPQSDALSTLHDIGQDVDYRGVSLVQIAEKASEKSREDRKSVV